MALLSKENADCCRYGTLQCIMGSGAAVPVRRPGCKGEIVLSTGHFCRRVDPSHDHWNQIKDTGRFLWTSHRTQHILPWAILGPRTSLRHIENTHSASLLASRQQNCQSCSCEDRRRSPQISCQFSGAAEIAETSIMDRRTQQLGPQLFRAVQTDEAG